MSWYASQKNHPIVARLTEIRARSLQGGKLPSQSDQWMDWKPSRWDRAAHPDLPADACIRVRLIAAPVVRRGKAIQLYLVTTLDLPVEQILELYGFRWNIELDLRSLKNPECPHRVSSSLASVGCPHSARPALDAGCVPAETPWSAPFPPQPPPRRLPLCSAASSVLRRSPTPPWRIRPDCGYSPFRTDLLPQTPRRSPGSRAYCFSACLGSSTTPGPAMARDLSPFAGVAFPLTEKGRRPVLSFRSSITQPTDASVYASPAASRRPMQDSEVRMESLLLSCRALSSPTTCRFIPAHSAPHQPTFQTLPLHTWAAQCVYTDVRACVSSGSSCF